MDRSPILCKLTILTHLRDGHPSTANLVSQRDVQYRNLVRNSDSRRELREFKFAKRH